MASRDSWIDRREMEELAGQLGGASPFPDLGEKEDMPTRTASKESGPIPLMPGTLNPAYSDEDGAGEENVASPEAIAQLDRKLAEIKAIAERSGLLMDREAPPAANPVSSGPLPAPQPAKELPGPRETFYRPSGSLKQRLSGLRIWLSRIPIPMRLFAINSVGDPLMAGSESEVEKGTESRLVAAALALFEALRSHRVQRCSHSGSATVEIGDAGLLTIYPATAHGAEYLLCVVTGVPVPPETGRVIAKAFATVL